MGIALHTANAIIAAHRNDPIRGRVLSCGRQSVFLTPEGTADLLRSHGLEPRIAPQDCEVDHETKIGGESGTQRSGGFISDRSFFRMLGVEAIEFLDHSDYEGAGTIVDLNEPLPPQLESAYDFILDGGTLDNVFNPAQALMNLSRMLRPGGRLFTFNFYANFGATYANLPHQWYLDYFAINRFAFAQTYFRVYDGPGGATSVYQANLAKRAATRQVVLNFPAVEPGVGIGIVAYAVKAADSTWHRQPSQECYRPEAEWAEMTPVFARFAAFGLRFPIVKSAGATPIVMPGGDDFEYIDIDGLPVTQRNREDHDRRLRANTLAAMKAMDEGWGGAPWGIVETEKLFFDLLGQSAEARAIVAKANVLLFDVRMLNESTVVEGVRKKIQPATAALVAGIPLLVICTEPNVDVMWKRMSRYFRHLKLYAACQHRTGAAGPDGLVSYFSFGTLLSPSLENGAYRGYSIPYPRAAESEPAR